MADRDYVLEDQVGHLLRRAHQRATQIFLDAFAETGLTPTQWAALARLVEEGAASQNHLGRMTAMDPATIQGVVQRLEKRGLVDREPDPDDRRRTRLKPSAEGAALVADHVATGARVTALTLAPLTTAETTAFLDALRKLS